MVERADGSTGRRRAPPELVAANEQGNRAFAAGQLEAAAEAYAAAVRLLGPADEPAVAAAVHGNLGLALYNLGRYPAAIRSFLRALDGQPSAREQWLRLLVTSLVRDGRTLDALRCCSRYRHHFGTHPH
ncbi:MAG: tetratricopeptide repeat protein, partial [Deltaproteobacteria bacterium]|nr:tetratricopeptide repeat protein [Deltaproteobacteria bacterium]